MTRHLSLEWEKLKEHIARFESVLILLDYDGTLTPIVSSPERTRFDKRIKGILSSLSKAGFGIGVISGRRLKDLRALLGIRDIYYAGNHGLEIEGPGIRFTHPRSRIFKRALEEIRDELKERLRGIRGVIVEYKGLSISVHYRMAPREDIPRLRRVFRAAISPYIRRKMAAASRGKKVLEVRTPIKWNKGSAVKLIKRRTPGCLTVYIGDDVTDEDAFKVLGRKDIPIRVGASRVSRARYHLKDTDEVCGFLDRLKGLR